MAGSNLGGKETSPVRAVFPSALTNGTIAVAGMPQPVLGASLAGRELRFSFVDRDGGLRAVRLDVDGDRASGESRLGEYAIRWTAQRVR